MSTLNLIKTLWGKCYEICILISVPQFWAILSDKVLMESFWTELLVKELISLKFIKFVITVKFTSLSTLMLKIIKVTIFMIDLHQLNTYQVQSIVYVAYKIISNNTHMPTVFIYIMCINKYVWTAIWWNC